MPPRNRVACDRCHALKIKCITSIHQCVRCTRLNIECKYTRKQLKRGRQPSRLSGLGRPLFVDSSAVPSVDGGSRVEYPVLNVLSAYPGLSPLYSRSLGSELLEHFFSSPNQELHTRIIRQRRLLELEQPRPTSPGVLLSILCIACYMPTANGEPITNRLNAAELVSFRRNLLSLTLKHLNSVYVGEVDPTFEDAVATSMLVWVCTSEDSIHFQVPRLLSILKFLVLQLNLNVERLGFDEESKEERRRLWWATYVVDRHSAFSFNLRTQLTEVQCEQLYRPIPDRIWESSEPLSPRTQYPEHLSFRGTDYSVHSLDLFGIFIPLSSILGNILEYHFLRQHLTFGSDRSAIASFRQNIEQNLETWFRSLDQKLHSVKYSKTSDPPGSDDTILGRQSCHPMNAGRFAIYGEHMYHCMYILLYGKMDYISMYRDITWLSSPDFITAGEHAMICGKVAGEILKADPKLDCCYRYFGTYLLQSSFVFLILAQRLGSNAGRDIFENCHANLRVLDVFVQKVNIGYQRTFARLLRRTLSKRIDTDGDVGGSTSDFEPFDDPELMKYRWIGGYTGLWFEDMGRPSEAKQRLFAE